MTTSSNKNFPAAPELNPEVIEIDGTEIIVPPRGQKDYQPGNIVDRLFVIESNELGGIEPKFSATKIDADLLNQTNDIRLGHTPIKDERHFIAYFARNPDKAEKLAQAIAKKQKEIGDEKELPFEVKVLLFKGAYDEGTFAIPPKRRIQNTSAIKKLPQNFQGVGVLFYQIYRGLCSSRSQENINGILECVASQVARAYGMQAQDQSVTYSTYVDGFPKILPTAVMVKLEDFKYRLAGSKHHNKYLVKLQRDKEGKIVLNPNGTPAFLKLECSNNQSYAISDNSIIDLPLFLALILQIGDPDKVGSMGQNMANVLNRLFGFDFGHAHRGNHIIETLEDDFTFVQPSGKDCVKNISVFYDNTLSQKMQGMFLLYQMSTEETLNEIFTTAERMNICNAILKYKNIYPLFSEIISKIKPGSEENIFDQEYEKLIAKANDLSIDSKSQDEYLLYASKVKEARKAAVYARVDMLNIFKRRMQLEPKLLDLIDQLELFCSETTMLSNDKKVLLHHIRRKPHAKRNIWQVENSDGDLILTASLSNPNQFTAYLSSLNLKSCSFEKTASGEYRLTCSNDDKDALFKAFTESKVMGYKEKQAPRLHPVLKRVAEPVKPNRKKFYLKIALFILGLAIAGTGAGAIAELSILAAIGLTWGIVMAATGVLTMLSSCLIRKTATRPAPTLIAENAVPSDTIEEIARADSSSHAEVTKELRRDSISEEDEAEEEKEEEISDLAATQPSLPTLTIDDLTTPVRRPTRLSFSTLSPPQKIRRSDGFFLERGNQEMRVPLDAIFFRTPRPNRQADSKFDFLSPQRHQPATKNGRFSTGTIR